MVQRREEVAGCDRIHTHLACRVGQVVGQPLGKHIHSGLAACVCRHHAQCIVGCHGGNVDDGAAIAAHHVHCKHLTCHHGAQPVHIHDAQQLIAVDVEQGTGRSQNAGLFCGQICCLRIYLDDLCCLFVACGISFRGGFCQRVLNACAVDQHFIAAKVLHHSIAGLFQRSFVRNIHLECCGIAASLFDLAGHLLACLNVKIKNRYPVSGLCKLLGKNAAEAAAGTGNHYSTAHCKFLQSII